MIKVLVIGNGFDKAHGLKTGYVDFLEWFELVQHVYEHKYRGGIISFSLEDARDVNDFFQENPDEFYTIIDAKNNFWVSHFLKIKTEIGAQWLDFETEIERLVKHIYKQLQEKGLHNLQSILRREMESGSNVPSFVTIQECFAWLYKELRILTRALEIYLCRCANRTIDEKARMDLFTKIKANKLLSFNYTSTYQDVYNRSVKTDYIHGKAQMHNEIEKCCLVLGFDDHYLESVDTISELIPFEKILSKNCFSQFK